MSFVNLSSHEIRAAGFGREHELMTELIGSDRMHKKGQPCPSCGGDDRFAYNPKNNTFYCRGLASGGDWFSLLVHIEGDYIQAKDRAKAMLGLDESNYDLEELKRLQLERSEQRAKDKLIEQQRASTNSSLLDSMFELEQMIMNRGSNIDPCDNELSIARSVYSGLNAVYSK